MESPLERAYIYVSGYGEIITAGFLYFRRNIPQDLLMYLEDNE